MPDLKKYFSVGSKIQIDYLDAAGQLQSYTSQVVEILDDEFIDVLIPIHKKRDVYLKQDAMLKVIVTKGEAVYEFKAVLHEKLFGRIPLLRLKVLAEINKIQRRDYYRLKVLKDIEARLVEDFKEKKFGETFKGNLHDISAGGLNFSTRKELQENDMLELTLNLNDKKLVVYGIVLRRTLTNNYKASYAYGVKFEKITEAERNEIVKYIFEEQRRLIKKGLM